MPPSINTSTDKQDSGIDGIYLFLLYNVCLLQKTHTPAQSTVYAANNEISILIQTRTVPHQPNQPVQRMRVPLTFVTGLKNFTFLMTKSQS